MPDFTIFYHKTGNALEIKLPLPIPPPHKLILLPPEPFEAPGFLPFEALQGQTPHSFLEQLFIAMYSIAD